MPKKRSTGATRTPVERILHDEATRTNIPTNELGSFMEAEEKAPAKILYPRDPSLDPQLVWKGKDGQDAGDLEVPVLPIYIQEKIHPKALIEDLRARTTEERDEQTSLFGDFNGIEFDDLVEFYQHEQSWTNRLILGDSLAVMTSLAEKEGLKGQVQCVYVDPPYGIGFGSNWQVSTTSRAVKDGQGESASRQPEQVKAYRDTWSLGVHSYLTYLRDRLFLARELLTESGSIFVQIGSRNAHLVTALLAEIFGPDNHVETIAFRKKTMPLGGRLLEGAYDYLVWFAKDKERIKYRPLYQPKTVEGDSHWNLAMLPDGSLAPLDKEQISDHSKLPEGAELVRLMPIYPVGPFDTGIFDFDYKGTRYVLPPGKSWPSPKSGMDRLAAAGRLHPYDKGQTLQYVLRMSDYPVTVYNNVWTDTSAATGLRYVVETSPKVVQRCMLMTTDPGDLVLDPTCGSGTTPYVAEQWDRRWIGVDTSRVALALSRQRLMSARYPYFRMTDGVGRNIRQGFKYKAVSHITLKSIANNPDIREGMSREEIEGAISRYAEHEVLYDQPEVDPKIVRVTGPFTAESLSPHVAVPIGSEVGAGATENGEHDVQRFHTTVMDHLRKAGVQNTVRSERLVFDSLEPWAGVYVHAVGEYREVGTVKRAAVAIGPEYGTVNAEFVREAAKEAAGVFDLVLVCGMAFDGYLDQELKKLGGVTILKAAMNPDLAMGDELLKKTGSGNLFMVFGEPDIDVRHTGGEVVVEIRGLDVYDPTTGEIRSHSTDDIACWFIDTAYNAESFFVRHAYFTGSKDPYEQLKRALQADIDEGAWASLYRTQSRPFPEPQTGKIAVKVINHYGDEVMKVYEVGEGR